MNTDNSPQFYTVKAVADLLKVTKRTIFRYISQKNNPLPIIRLSDQTIRIPVDQFDIWLNNLQETQPKEGD